MVVVRGVDGGRGVLMVLVFPGLMFMNVVVMTVVLLLLCWHIYLWLLIVQAMKGCSECVARENTPAHGGPVPHRACHL